MPGPEDYSYEHEDEKPAAFEPLTVEVTQADSNPAYYPPEAKSEELRTEDEKKALKEAQTSAADRGEKDVVNGEGETVMTADEAKSVDEQNAAAVEQAAKDAEKDPDKPAAKTSTVPKAKK